MPMVNYVPVFFVVNDKAVLPSKAIYDTVGVIFAARRVKACQSSILDISTSSLTKEPNDFHGSYAA